MASSILVLWDKERHTSAFASFASQSVSGVVVFYRRDMVVLHLRHLYIHSFQRQTVTDILCASMRQGDTTMSSGLRHKVEVALCQCVIKRVRVVRNKDVSRASKVCQEGVCSCVNLASSRVR